MDVRALHRHLGAFVRPLADALLPVQCPGCGAWDVTLCQACAALARGTPEWHVLDGEGEVGDLPLWSLGAYAGSLRRLVLAAKHRPHVDLLGFLDRCGETLGASLACSPLMVGERCGWCPPPRGGVADTWTRWSPRPWPWGSHGGSRVPPDDEGGAAWRWWMH